MDTTGTGEALIFQDGKVITGTWEKKFKGDRETYYDDQGNEIALNAGQIWIEIVIAVSMRRSSRIVIIIVLKCWIP